MRSWPDQPLPMRGWASGCGGSWSSSAGRWERACRWPVRTGPPPRPLIRSAERLVNLLALFCILAWRVFWLTMLNRTAPKASPRLVLTPLEIRLLDQLVKDKTSSPAPTLAQYLTKIARLGGYLARAKDPPPGNMVMWRGLSRLTDIELGASLGMRLVGN